MRRLEVTEDLSAGAGEERAPGSEIHAVADETHAAIGERAEGTARMMAATAGDDITMV